MSQRQPEIDSLKNRLWEDVRFCYKRDGWVCDIEWAEFGVGAGQPNDGFMTG
jgi:hypothetical protein